jgi:hypothetical protein
VCKNLPPFFVSKVNKMEKFDRPDADTLGLIKLEVIVDQTFQHKVPNTPNTLLTSRMDVQRSSSVFSVLVSFREIENLMPLKYSTDKSTMFSTLLKSHALSFFELHLKRRLEAKDSELSYNDLIELGFRDMNLEYISRRST